MQKEKLTYLDFISFQLAKRNKAKNFTTWTSLNETTKKECQADSIQWLKTNFVGRFSLEKIDEIENYLSNLLDKEAFDNWKKSELYPV